MEKWSGKIQRESGHFPVKCVMKLTENLRELLQLLFLNNYARATDIITLNSTANLTVEFDNQIIIYLLLNLSSNPCGSDPVRIVNLR